MQKIIVSGFSDEIAPELDVQLSVVKELGMRYISLRSADHKNISDYTLEEVRTGLLPRLQGAGIGVSSLGSPIGKVAVDDEAAFVKQLTQLHTLCEICNLLDCGFIRVFSFYIPHGQDPGQYRAQVVQKLGAFAKVAGEHGVVLLHENEKDIYGDTGARCLDLMQAVNSDALQCAFDFANFVQCGEDPCVCWKLLQPWVKYIHIKDAVANQNENVLCGTGDGCIEQLLRRAILEEGYQGFLTLEPHLVLFESLQSLEISAATDIIKENKYKTGAEGFAAQYKALCEILERL